MNLEQWEKAGGIRCPNCKKEVVQLIDGLCHWCYNEKEADKSMRRYYNRRLREGSIRLAALKENQLD